MVAWEKASTVVLLVTWCFSEASTGAQQIEEALSSIKNRTFTLPSNCPTSCGFITIQYPFGIGHGCHLPGFNLTCLDQYSRNVPARLFMADGTLEVTGIDLPLGFVSFKLPVIRMGAKQNYIATSLIDLQNYHNYNFWETDNFLFVSGCNVNASLVDLANNNTIINSCSTICLDVSSDLLPFVIRRQNCSIQIGRGLPDRIFIGVHLTRLYQITELHFAKATVVNVSMSYASGSSESKLSWYMGDHSSCTEAMNDMGTYACISSNSDCKNALPDDKNGTVGYYCRCSGVSEGNPYLTDGCKDVTAIIYPAKICTRTCGRIDIPFPFGLNDESDCYRDSSFELFCNQTTTPPVLQYQGKNVSEVDIESGELHLMVRDSSQGLTEEHHSWMILYHSCKDATKYKSNFACVSENSRCYDINGSKGDQLGYRCRCEQGYTGNPYALNGCHGT